MTNLNSSLPRGGGLGWGLILHSIWHQRRSYVWIALELIFVSFFLWVVIDPIYFAAANSLIDDGYDADSCYVVDVGQYRLPSQKGYRADADNDSAHNIAVTSILQTLRNDADIQSFVFVRLHAIPGSGNYAGGALATDTMVEEHDAAQFCLMFEGIALPGTDFVRTYGLRLFPSDKQLPEGTPRAIYISQYMAECAFGTTDCVGRNLYYLRSADPLPVAGVFRDVKKEMYSQPVPVVIDPAQEVGVGSWSGLQHAVVRLRPSADPSQVEARLREKCAVGNYFLRDFTSFRTMTTASSEVQKTRNQLAIRIGLSAFGVLCIMLGMLGTFWVRCNARRGDIAVMRAMGASRGAVMRHFLSEALLLVTFGLLLAMPLCYAYAHYIGLATPEPVLGDKVFISEHYPQNILWQHFLHLTIIAYVLLVIVTIVAVAIPVLRAINTLPADGLKEE